MEETYPQGYRPLSAAGTGASPAPLSEEDAEGLPPDMDAFLAYAVDNEASDIHIVAGKRPMARIRGILAAIPGYRVLTPDDSKALAYGLMGEETRKRLDLEREVDFSYTFGGRGRFRVNSTHQRKSVSASLRLVPMNPVPLEDLDLPATIKGFADLRDGLVLITGPTGSGKSTTLASLIDRINRDRAVHIVTVEDPIEFHHRHKQAIVEQREVESDTVSFARALKSVLRQDPDVVLIGEMRDLETISAAVTTAETGHLVFATLHTNTAASAIDRIIDAFPAGQQAQVRAQLSASLRAVVAQRLLPAIGGGRHCVAEVLVATPAVANLIREGKTHQLASVLQTGQALGMVSFDTALAAAVRSGRVRYEDAEPMAVEPSEFRSMAGRGPSRGVR